MKSSVSSFSSTSTFGLRRLRLLVSALVVIFLSFVATSATTPKISNPPNSMPRNPQPHNDIINQETYHLLPHHHRHPNCGHQNSVSQSSSAQLRSLCLQLNHRSIFHGYQPLSPPSPAGPSQLAQDHHDNEIDPRYGVEKRLVPSGPNPLHN